jgi:Tetratricopeptide repeat
VRLFAGRHNSRAMKLEEAGETDRAIESYLRAIESDPSWSVPWFNLGLLYKRLHNWPESFRHNKRATELNPGDEAAWWNLGIAATALGDWQQARAAWRAYGIDMPDGDGPPDLDYGPTPIRINPDGGDYEPEVLWCRRIDPARAIIDNVPLPDSGHRCGDLLLHDGAPAGTRVHNGVELAVFNELAVLQPSESGTFIVTLGGFTASEAAALVDAIDNSGLTAEDWTANIRYLCKACSEGNVEHEHEEPEDDEAGERRIGVAAPNERAVRDVLATHAGSVVSVECALAPLPMH